MMRDIEEKFGSLNDFLRETRLERISTRLTALGIDSIAALATLQQKDIDDIRSMLKPVQAKIFDREIGERITRIEQPTPIPRNDKPTRPASPLRQCVDDAERYMPDDCYLEYSAEQLLVMIEECTRYINMLNCFIAKEPVAGMIYSSKHSPGALNRLQASKETYIDRLRLLRRLLESGACKTSQAPLFPPPIPSLRDEMSRRIRRKLHFDPSIPEDNHKRKSYAKKQNDEEDLKRLRDAERQRFAQLGSKNHADAESWTCRMCKQVNGAVAASCRDCKESRYHNNSYHAYLKPTMALDTYNRTYQNTFSSSSRSTHSDDYCTSTTATTRMPSSSRFSDYYSSTSTSLDYYKHPMSLMDDPHSSRTSLRGSAIQQNGPARSLPLKHNGTYDSTGMRSSLETPSRSVVKVNSSKSRPSSPSTSYANSTRSTHTSLRPQSPQPCRPSNASSSIPPPRASTPLRSAVTEKPRLPNRSSSTGRMNRSAGVVSSFSHGRKWGV